MFANHSAMDSQSSFYRHSTTAKTENAYRMRGSKNKSVGNSINKGRMTKAEFQKRLMDLQVNIPISSNEQSPMLNQDYGQLDLSVQA